MLIYSILPYRGGPKTSKLQTAGSFSGRTLTLFCYFTKNGIPSEKNVTKNGESTYKKSLTE